MNKILIVFIVAAAIIGVGVYAGGTPVCETTGVTKQIDMVVGSWYFSPENVVVNCGDRVMLKIRNEDPYDHGFGLDLFGLNQRILANSEITVDFVANERGTFPFYCTVPCGSGTDKITKTQKGHFEQRGSITIN